MALVVEDGTAKADAEAYISVADADAYFLVRENPTAWTGASTADKEAALRIGAQYMDTKFRWRAQRYTSTQALAWPRVGIYRDGVFIDIQTLPTELGQANAEVAALHLADSSNLFPTTTLPGTLTGKTTKVGPITIKNTWTGADQEKAFTKVNGMLRGLTSSATLERG